MRVTSETLKITSVTFYDSDDAKQHLKDLMINWTEGTGINEQPKDPVEGK